jgi:hypothetical protein
MWQAVRACAGLRPHLGIRECWPKRYNSCILWTIGYRRDYQYYCHYCRCCFFPPTGRMLWAISHEQWYQIKHLCMVILHSTTTHQLAAPLETLLAIIQPHAKSQKPTQASQVLLTQRLLTYLARTALRLGHLPVTPFRSEANPANETGNRKILPDAKALEPHSPSCKFPQQERHPCALT